MQQETTKEELSLREIFQPYKIEALKKTLEARAKGGNPYFFKIQINGVMIVERTSDLTQFDNYQELLPDLQEMIIWVFSNEKTPNYYMKKVFTGEKEQEPLKQQILSTQQGLSGAEVSTMLDERMKTERLSWNYELLQKELQQTKEALQKEIDSLKQQLAEAEEYMEKQDLRHEQDLQAIENLKAKRKLEDRDLGATLSGAAEGLLRRNPHWLTKLGPGGEALAGFLQEDNAQAESVSNQSESETTFSKKTENTSVTEEEKRYLSTLKRIEENFKEEQINTVMGIIEYLSDNPEKVDTVADLLDVENSKSPDNK